MKGFGRILINAKMYSIISLTKCHSLWICSKMQNKKIENIRSRSHNFSMKIQQHY